MSELAGKKAVYEALQVMPVIMTGGIINGEMVVTQNHPGGTCSPPRFWGPG